MVSRSSGKYSFWWVDLARIVRDLQQELDRDPGPDWGRVERKAADLAALVKAAAREESRAGE